MKGMRALVTRRIHNYFFVKALDTVRDGGLVAFITSQGVLNAKNNSACLLYTSVAVLFWGLLTAWQEKSRKLYVGH